MEEQAGGPQVQPVAVAPLAASAEASFDVYGYRFTLISSSERALTGIAQDFAYFRSETARDAERIEMEQSDPDYSGVPACDASVYTPRNVVYRDAACRYIDYGGRGLGVYDEEARVFRITSRDPHLLYEAAYLFLLSRIGSHLDSHGLHRLHAVGMAWNGRAILVLLPSGGGKSTLCRALLEWPEITLLSDDSPIIDRRGRLLAFPLHLGLEPGRENGIPAEYRRVVERMEFGPKVLISLEYFRDRIRPAADPGLVFIGRRTMAEACRIERAAFTTALRAMVAHSVIGVGLFQGLEFLLRSSPWELFGKAGLGASRLRNAVTLLQRSETFVLHMGRDPNRTAAAIVELARRRFG